MVDKLPDGKRIFVGDDCPYSDNYMIEKLIKKPAFGDNDNEYDYVLCVKKAGKGYLGGYED